MMEGKETGQFSIGEKNGLDKKQDPIELLFCPQKTEGSNCKEHRAVINQSILASRRHLMHKEYQVSIAELKTAFYKTTELQEATCLGCASLFRETIIQSMEQIHEDLKEMTTGLFKSKRYLPAFELADEVLAEFKKRSQE